MTVAFKDIIGLIQTLVWPLVVVVALVVLRDALSSFLKGLGQRATKFSAFQFTVELATVSEFRPTWSIGAADVRRLTPSQVFDSASQTLFDQIRSDTASDYAIVDLGTGHQWLASRLFIFAVMLERMRGLKCFVFLETQGDVRRQFLGVASTDSVRWALAIQYPWLEAALAKAYSQVTNYQICSVRGALQSWVANQLVNTFVAQIQQNQRPSSDESEWITLDQQLWEHAKWLDGADLERILGSVLQASWILASPDTSPAEQARAVLRREGPFVAMVEEKKLFRSLVDRQALLEQIAAHPGTASDDDLSAKEQ